ncbi:MAG: hypothetical protein G3M70_06940 [Candidatus Nitronauta litoralis]|uniref:Uncharacterized protein n=1 Tax=Candidatus Nitronauta litoralis TaxID=2705533 RepID=A0A7T0FZW2_9BACT|nr:MAG: hypothetical protein G3M70_06940 [Candidatus Nitronauta litoralis]
MVTTAPYTINGDPMITSCLVIVLAITCSFINPRYLYYTYCGALAYLGFAGLRTAFPY